MSSGSPPRQIARTGTPLSDQDEDCAYGVEMMFYDHSPFCTLRVPYPLCLIDNCTSGETHDPGKRIVATNRPVVAGKAFFRAVMRLIGGCL